MTLHPIPDAPDAPDAIVVLLDGQPRSIARGTTLADLVGQLGHAPDQVTSAVNGLFVARTQRADCVLQPGDAVLFFKAIVGG